MVKQVCGMVCEGCFLAIQSFHTHLTAHFRTAGRYALYLQALSGVRFLCVGVREGSKGACVCGGYSLGYPRPHTSHTKQQIGEQYEPFRDPQRSRSHHHGR